MRDMTTPVLLGDFKIDPVTQVLIRTTDNESVKLSRSESLIVCMLAEKPNVAVSRDALLEGCWTGKVVTNSSLTVAIKHIRSAFLELGAEDVIVTEPKKGYLIRLHATENIALEAEDKPPATGETVNEAHTESVNNSVLTEIKQTNVNFIPVLAQLTRRYLVTIVAFIMTIVTLSQMMLFVEDTHIDKHHILYDGQSMPPAIINAIKAHSEPKSKMIAYPLGGICDSYQLIAIDKQNGFIDLTSYIEQGDCRG
ncbi:winged helix-turn-helix domain-containing protein [Photobacterium lutimaris]|nr:winged helix-turn-helix domain-containing protein [Photobacterium lutimaris]TDR71492.1 DNA-binding winged helix-turn-helix (wHTH) protein [Photobacterium lutimaris]